MMKREKHKSNGIILKKGVTKFCSISNLCCKPRHEHEADVEYNAPINTNTDEQFTTGYDLINDKKN